jgi:hypothetical protein
MNTVTSRRRTRGATQSEGTETVVQDLDHPAVGLLAKYLGEQASDTSNSWGTGGSASLGPLFKKPERRSVMH